MDKINASKHLALACAGVALTAAIGLFWLLSVKKPGSVTIADLEGEKSALKPGKE